MAVHFRTMCESTASAQKDGKFNELPWVLAWGSTGSGRKTLAAKMAAFAGRPLLALNPMLAEKGMLDDLLRRAQREALLRGAVLYIGPISGELLQDNAKELAKRIAEFPAVIVLGIEGMQPPRMRIDRPVNASNNLWVAFSSSSTRLVGLSPRLGCVNVWLPTSCPSSISRCTNSG
jgi:hypothetical protein